MEEEVLEKYFEKAAQKINLELSEEEIKKFMKYKNIIKNWNEKINLTAIIDDKEFLLKHFIDSLTINKYIEENNKIIDIGTGAGFPGIPIKIVNKDIEIDLLDSLNKRLIVLNEVIEELKLKNIKTIHGRAEEIFQKEEYREKYDIAVSRAVASLKVLVELMMPAIKVGGKCICMKGKNSEEEINEARKAIKILGGEIEEIKSLTLPESDNERTIIIIRKTKKTSLKYPRKPGTPQSKPIK